VDEYTAVDASSATARSTAGLPAIWNDAVGMVYPVYHVKLSSF